MANTVVLEKTDAVLYTILCMWEFYHVSGCKLSEFERVTALKVYNWFANRRKEMKRRANIGEDMITWISSKSQHLIGSFVIVATHSCWDVGPSAIHFLCFSVLFRFLGVFLFFLSQPEAAILESHGIEVASPSCQSNGEEAEMHEFADQVNHRFSEQVSQLVAT